jgi:hypothetical protein
MVLDRLSRAGQRGLGTCVYQLTAEKLRIFFPFRTALLACMLAGLGSFAYAQQIDFAVGGSTLWSPKPHTASEAFLPPALSGGTYANASLQYLGENRFGLSIEGAALVKEGLYNGFQYYRPFLYDVNGVYARRMAAKVRADFMAGVGGQTVVFYNTGSCTFGNGCRTLVNSTHFTVHLGVGVRYYFWRTFFVRPEAHYYFIPNNDQFHSDNLFRVGVSIGHTFGSH